MTFAPEGSDRGPRKETVWLRLPTDKGSDIRISGVAKWERSKAHSTGISRNDRNCQKQSFLKLRDQPEEVSDLRHLGERARHAAQYYPAASARGPATSDGDGRRADEPHPQNVFGDPVEGAEGGRARDEPYPDNGLSHSGGPAEDKAQDDPEVIVVEEGEEEKNDGGMPRVLRAPKARTAKESALHEAIQLPHADWCE